MVLCVRRTRAVEAMRRLLIILCIMGDLLEEAIHKDVNVSLEDKMEGHSTQKKWHR
jgi:hypothetical protein